MKKYFIIILCEALLLLAFLLLIILNQQEANQSVQAINQESLTPVAVVPDVCEASQGITPNPTFTTEPDTSDCVPSVSGIIREDEPFAEITIYTDYRTRTYEIMPDVAEETLKDNIGWLPSSSLPCEEGTCILMGHRDTDFRILKNCDAGDMITVSLANTNYNYTVSYIEILDDNEYLKFNTNPNYSLILVTCYPFYYTGHAPQKILFYCIRK